MIMMMTGDKMVVGRLFTCVFTFMCSLFLLACLLGYCLSRISTPSKIIFTFECVSKILEKGRSPFDYWTGDERYWNNFDFWLVRKSIDFGTLFLVSLYPLHLLFQGIYRLAAIRRRQRCHSPPFEVDAAAEAGGEGQAAAGHCHGPGQRPKLRLLHHGPHVPLLLPLRRHGRRAGA